FVGAIPVGAVALRDAPPWLLLAVWDGLAAGFLFVWVTGLVADLQRSELLSLDKLLHLPMSLTGVFVINYVSSIICFPTIVLVPAMVGLAIGLVYSHGLAMLWQFPLLAGLLLMVTGLTYQFQGWLAALMSNPRRRRTVIVMATALLILLAQLPNLINILRPWDRMVESPSGQIAEEA